MFMSHYIFKRLLDEWTKNAALIYLTNKQGIKGHEIKYSDLQMSDYLLPNSQDMTINVKRKIFAMRNMMTNIPANFSSSKIIHKCVCGDNEEMKHIYTTCSMLNSEKPMVEYENINSNKIKMMKEVNKRFEVNL